MALDVTALGHWLRRSGQQVVEPLTANRIGLGQSNLTYLLTDAAGWRGVARRPPLGHLLASAHDVAREHRILTALGRTGVPVPGVLGLCRDERVADVPVLVVEHVDGLVVDRLETAEAMPPGLRRAVGLELGRVLADLHAVDPAEVGLHDLASHAPYAQRQLRRWSRQWAESRTRELPELEKLTDLLRDRAPEPGDLVLVHGDFHLVNLIVDPSSGAVRAVLDWELSTLGDPLADLGSLLAYWQEPGDPPLGLFNAARLPGFPSRAEISAAYAERSGRDLAALPFWHVLGLWKVAIILEGVYRRALDTPANAARPGTLPDRDVVDRLVAQAWSVARHTGLDR
ncbi:phosphotransferase family protein [Micromonospora sp. WMMD998]|uniref:phosphotransferase family protein n=1 Tax=Micromonospora sp. WMMD998 TaxID=3016092 RepID=UPI00249C4EDC|nr:phosphotransferase family protein [Micromonospora sp. WMMD998]WFE40970.1 phosphotransferase family protein [Micromonospora sp. WMMD998]